MLNGYWNNSIYSYKCMKANVALKLSKINIVNKNNNKDKKKTKKKSQLNNNKMLIQKRKTR